MGDQRPYHDDSWEDLEPEKRQEPRWIFWLSIVVILLIVVGLGLIGFYFLRQQFQIRTEPVPPLVVPTSPVATPTREPTPTNLPLAPTATLVPPGALTPEPVSGGEVIADTAALPPILDGDLSEWTGMNLYESAFQVHTAGSWDGSDDLRALWRLSWDADQLYIGVEVFDDIHVQNQTGNLIFRGDSLDMQLDTDLAGDYGDGLSPDDIQIIFSPGDFAGLAPSAFRFQGSFEGQILDAPGHSIRLAAVATTAGYQLEAAIPWSDLNLTPQTGLVIGLALNANDNDLPGTAIQEVMKSHVASRTLTNPTTWGTLTLR
jgi:hypothetical protein